MFRAARDNVGIAAEALLAYRTGGDEDLAFVGAALEAEFFALVRGALGKR